MLARLMRSGVVTLAALLTFAVGAGPACPALGLGPHAVRLTVETDASGFVTRPGAVELALRLDPEDADPVVWVSTSPDRTSAGVPRRATVGSCRRSELVVAAEPATHACRLSTSLLEASKTYHWWIVSDRTGVGRIVAGPYTFTLTTASGTDQTASSATAKAAARLVTRSRFAGTRSIKHSRLTSAIAMAFRAIRPPRTLAVACWTDRDFASVLAAAGIAERTSRMTIEGVWLGEYPRWVHLSGRTCRSVDRVLGDAAVTGLDVFGLVVALHEATHAYGIRNEAQANCYAVQLVPAAAVALRISRSRAERIGRTAVDLTRATAPRGYWSSARCRDGGRWDLPRIGARLGG